MYIYIYDIYIYILSSFYHLLGQNLFPILVSNPSPADHLNIPKLLESRSPNWIHFPFWIIRSSDREWSPYISPKKGSKGKMWITLLKTNSKSTQKWWFPIGISKLPGVLCSYFREGILFQRWDLSQKGISTENGWDWKMIQQKSGHFVHFRGGGLSHFSKSMQMCFLSQVLRKCSVFQNLWRYTTAFPPWFQRPDFFTFRHIKRCVKTSNRALLLLMIFMQTILHHLQTWFNHNRF